MAKHPLIGKPLPTTLGGLDRRFCEIDSAVAALELRTKLLKAERDGRVLDAIESKIKAQRLDEFRSPKNVYEYEEMEVAKVDDPVAFLRFALQKDNADLLQKNLCKLTSARERWGDGKVIPGVARSTFTKFRKRALPGKKA